MRCVFPYHRKILGPKNMNILGRFGFDEKCLQCLSVSIFVHSLISFGNFKALLFGCLVLDYWMILGHWSVAFCLCAEQSCAAPWATSVSLPMFGFLSLGGTPGQIRLQPQMWLRKISTLHCRSWFLTCCKTPWLKYNNRISTKLLIKYKNQCIFSSFNNCSR